MAGIRPPDNAAPAAPPESTEGQLCTLFVLSSQYVLFDALVDLSQCRSPPVVALCALCRTDQKWRNACWPTPRCAKKQPACAGMRRSPLSWKNSPRVAGAQRPRARQNCFTPRLPSRSTRPPARGYAGLWNFICVVSSLEALKRNASRFRALRLCQMTQMTILSQ